MPASHPKVLSCLTMAFVMALSACEAGEESADGPRTDTATASGTDTATSDTALIAITKDPPNAVVCAAADSLDLSAGGGGTLSLPAQSHGHELRVPANSVPSGEQVRFTMRDLRKPYVAVNVAARPDVTFQHPVTLRLSYAGCTVPQTQGLAIFRWQKVQGGGSDWVEVPNSTVEPGDVVSVNLDRLSQYALGAS